MKKPYTSLLVILISVIGLGVSAAAFAQQRELVVIIPYDFVAGGKTLPAGTYTVSRLSDDHLGALSISSYEHETGVLVLANMFESTPVNDVKVTFDQIGNVHLVRGIEIRDGVYTFALPRATTLITATKRHGSMSASGTPWCRPVKSASTFHKASPS